jgi:hypothetical protein
MRLLPIVALLAVSSPVLAKGPMPEDLLKGRMIIASKMLPTRWTSVSTYVSQLNGLNRESLWYDKDTKKVKIEYAAFFARPVNDVQVNLVIYDTTNGRPERSTSTENFLGRGERALFNSIVLEQEDFPMNRRYLFVIESRRQVLASGTFILRGEGPHYSGRVTFSDEEVAKKD